MMTRTTERTVTINRPFSLTNSDETYPAGEYLVATDEEMISGLSFPIWCRVATTIHVRKGGTTQVWTIDPQELEFLLSRDAETTT